MKKVSLTDGTIIYFETNGASSDFSSQGLIDNVTTRIDEIADNTSKTISELVEKVKAGLDRIQPDEFEIEFGIKVGLEGSIIISKGTAEASITIKATWKK